MSTSMRSSIFARDVSRLDNNRSVARGNPSDHKITKPSVKNSSSKPRTIELNEVLTKNALPPLLSPTLPPWTADLHADIPKLDSPPKRVFAERTEHNGSHIYTFKQYTNGDRSLIVSLSVPKTKLSKLKDLHSVPKVRGLGISTGSRTVSESPPSSSHSSSASPPAHSEEPKKKVTRTDSPKTGISKSSVFKSAPNVSSVSTSVSSKQLQLPPVVTVSRKDKGKEKEKQKERPKGPDKTATKIGLEKTEPAKKEDDLKILSRKKIHWSNIARRKKHEADAYRKSNQYDLSVVASIDSLVMFVVSFSYEDQHSLAARRLLEVNSWKSLIPYASSVISGLEEMIKTPHETDLSTLLGLLFFLRGVIYKHLVDILKAEIKDNRQRGAGMEEITAFNDIIKFNSTLERDFWNGENILSYEKLRRDYPRTMAKSRKSLPKKEKSDLSVKPLTDAFYLPINPVVTDLKDISAITYSVLEEWCERERVNVKLAVQNSP
ncbi:unnamed protein product [Kuraishia capsulata CBS 1993]|uniref:Uncharacterized protein n=1 Tax=Kuraishia capsulata CBS 1993 TaxID=1382522 RepID=W6MFF1_9ASCO|nr:uncharacterized protein KUCA_T00000261001 [Kuraishia capsulata CBS 1993]CDK24301.1 unnamed protein product [Kuraishia capsulata CBS 1993]